MSSVIELISSGDSFYELSVGDSSPTYDISSSSDVLYEVTLDQPDSIFEVSISDTSPTYDIINFDTGMLSLALIDDSAPTAFKSYSSYKVSQLLTGYATTSHNHDLVYQPLGSYITTESDPIFSASPAFGITAGNITVLNNTSGTNTGDQDLSTYTNQGNTFNGANQLVQLNATGQLPAIDGSLLTGITGGGGSSTLTIQNKTTAYTVVAGDLGTIINCTSGTFTVSLTASATLGAGFNCWIWNTSTTIADTITIDANSTETIEGKTTIILQRNEGCQLVCDGTNWRMASQKEIVGYAENLAVAQTRPVATGNLAIAIGNSAIASGATCIALGYDAQTSSANGTALGSNSGSNGSRTATGAGAMALGGSYASGTDSFAAAIANNTSSYGATGANSVAIGSLCKATGTVSVAFGDSNTSSGARSFSSGRICTASGAYSVAMGYGSNVNTIAYRFSYAAGSSSVQRSDFLLYGITSDATPRILVADASGVATAGIGNQVILLNDSAYTFTGTVISKQSGSTNVASWKVEGVIVRGTTAGSTVLVASTVTAISNVPAWTLALSADTTNGGLAVTFTGATATNIRTVATIETSEVVYA